MSHSLSVPASPERSDDSAPQARRRSVSVHATDEVRRAGVLRLLAAGGIELEERAGVVVALFEGPATERVRHLRALIKAQAPAFVVVSTPRKTTPALLRRMLTAGVRGIVFDHDLEAALVATVDGVLAGQLVMPPVFGPRLSPPVLSHREKQVLRLVSAGYTNRQIADELYLTESTVKSHLYSVFTKLGARSRAEAAAMTLGGPA